MRAAASAARAAAALLLLAAAASAQAPEGVPAWMGAGGRHVEHPKGCRLGEIFVSAETWWRRELAPPGGFTDKALDHGHMHLETCWPQLLPLPPDAPFPLEVAPLLHQNGGKVDQVTVADATDSAFPTPLANRTALALFAANCTATGGTVTMAAPAPAMQTCRWAAALALRAADLRYAAGGLARVSATVFATQASELVPANGKTLPLRQRAHFQGHVLAPAGAKAVPAAAGAPPAPYAPAAPAVNFVRGFGWATTTNYTFATVSMPPKVPVGGLWRPWTASIAAGAPIARHQILLDANFHADIAGVVLRNESGPWPGGATPVDLVALFGADHKGWHKLVVQGKALDPVSGATQTGSLALWFEVANGAPPARACGAGAVPVATHASWDGALAVYRTAAAAAGAPPRLRSTLASPAPAAYALAPFAPMAAPSAEARAQMAKLTFDLAFFAAPGGIASASLWLFVSNSSGGAGRVLQAWDYALPAHDGVPCGAAGACAPVGSGALAATGAWSVVELDPAFVGSALASSPRTMTVVLGLAEGGGALGASNVAAALSAVNSVGSPVLLLTAACGAGAAVSGA
jgi:hypothetical protein